MTRDEIYDHLAQVYLGKRKKEDEQKKKELNAWLVINAVITLIIFFSAFYGLTAFLTKYGTNLQDSIIYSLHEGPITLAYDFKDDVAPVQRFVLTLPSLDAGKYKELRFAVRERDDVGAGVVKVIVRNGRNEESYFYVRGLKDTWREVEIPLDTFKQITDWSNVTNISFVLESWNVDYSQGALLIENVRFSS